jgi:KaiC/GvpD/RAD55 family RecA-like ATPase/PKD repeat protein
MSSRSFSRVSLLGLLVLVGALGPHVSTFIQGVYASPDANLLVFAEASSFARLDDVDPSGWFYRAVLYNPMNSNVTVTGLRWWYRALTAGEDFIDDTRNARCYDSRYFSNLPTVWVSANGDTTTWQYANGTISITVPAKEVIVTWIEVPTNSRNNNGIWLIYYVEASVGSQWISSPFYLSHSGHDKIDSTVFRADFNLTTDPNNEQQTHPNPEWLFNEDRSVIANLSTRVRVIPVTSSRNTNGIDYATVNVTFPFGWRYVPGSAYNPYGETITLDSVDGKNRLEWDLERDVLEYSTNQSMAQNYIEFNVTAPHVPGIHNFTVTSIVTSLGELWTTWENQYIYVVVKTPPNATFTYSPTTPFTGEDVTFNATPSYDLDGQIVSYFWDFGDGNNGTGSVTAHPYAENGTYAVTLTITDNDGLKDTTLETIIVQNTPPFAQFTESAEIVDTDVVINFNASDSYDPDGYIENYFWDFGDGTNATGITVSHAYAENGNYTVKLTVTDDDGASAIATDVKTILNRAPVASFVFAPQEPIAGETIIFNASDSYDLDGTILTFTWNFGDGNITAVTSPIVTHAYTTFGNYSVILNVTDNDNFYNSSTLILIVHNVDVAIVDVIVSATEVYVGQTLSISVVVRNEGTANETFNVTLYYDSAAIGTQTVTDLEPGTETTLRFSWDTTDVTPDVSYSIRVEASGVAGETDTDDNAATYDNVRVRSQDVPPPFDWSPTLPYLIPILLGVLGFVVVGIVRKKKEEGLGFEFFDEMTAGGIPDAYSVMIIGGAGSGKSVLCQQIAYNYLTKGRSCVYLTYDIFPSEVRQNMKNFGWETLAYEQEGAFILVDCYSPTASLNSEEKHNVERPFALSDLGIAISTTMGEVKHRSPRVFLDSTAPLFARVDASKVTEFLQDRSARIKSDNSAFFFTVGEGTIPSDLLNRLEEIVDCIIELDVHEEKGKTLRKIRIGKLRGRRVAHGWISFKIGSNKGISFFPPGRREESRKSKEES